MSKNAEWLKSQCNRYVNGECHTLRCMKRGGYKHGKVETYDCATCEPHEILLELEDLREENRSIERAFYQACDEAGI